MSILTADEAFGGFSAHVLSESSVIKKNEGAMTNAVKALTMLHDAASIDRAGLESGEITMQVVQQSQAITQIASNLGLGYKVEFPGLEMDTDLSQTLQAGLEAKENLIEKIIAKVKEFIRMIITSIKKLYLKTYSYMKDIGSKVEKLEKASERLSESSNSVINKEENKTLFYKVDELLGAYKELGVKDAVNTMLLRNNPLTTSIAFSTLPDSFLDITASRSAFTTPVEILLENPSIDVKKNKTVSEIVKWTEDDLIVYSDYFSTPIEKYLSVAYFTGKGKTEFKTFAKVLQITTKGMVLKDETVSAGDLRGLCSTLASVHAGDDLKSMLDNVLENISSLDDAINEMKDDEFIDPKVVSNASRLISVFNNSALKGIHALTETQKAAYATLSELYFDMSGIKKR